MAFKHKENPRKRKARRAYVRKLQRRAERLTRKRLYQRGPAGLMDLFPLDRYVTRAWDLDALEWAYYPKSQYMLETACALAITAAESCELGLPGPFVSTVVV